MDSVDAIQRTSIVPAGGGVKAAPQLLANLATVERSTAMSVINHYNVQPVLDVYASVQDRDLGGVARDIDKVLNDLKPRLPRGTTIDMRGQIDTMRSSFVGLGGGMVLAVLLVYFLMVVNLQSWLDPFIILTVLPGTFCGIIWMLYATETTINVPSLMGAIMSIGVATANSILLVTFANGQLGEKTSAREAVFSAGLTRLRPVLMTALAMIAGMLPMSLAMGEGTEQNASLGRAVIGGLLVATVATLFLVPVIYTMLKHGSGAVAREEDWELLQ
jgi:multidrug efflux pump subunit AcrB